MLTFLTACGGPREAALTFRSVETPLCDGGIEPKAAFYVSEFTLSDGTTVPLEGSGAVSLVELSPCDPSSEFRLTVSLPDGAANGVRFTVGVPERLNHAEPTRAQPPLDRSDMFWTWRQGYKFFALDGNNFAFHLGSTRCTSPAPVRPPAEPCGHSNRLTITLPKLDWELGVIGVDFGGLLAALGNGARCTGDYSSEPCTNAFAELGLDPASGRCGDGCGRNVFTELPE